MLSIDKLPLTVAISVLVYCGFPHVKDAAEGFLSKLLLMMQPTIFFGRKFSHSFTNNDMAKLTSVLLIVFLILFDPAIACAGKSVEWVYHLTGPNDLNGTMSVVQRGKTLLSDTELQRGLVDIINLHSRLLRHPDGTTISYIQQEFSDKKKIYSLRLDVRGHKITGEIDRNEDKYTLHYLINGDKHGVYIMGNNLLNGVQALLASLKGNSVKKDLVLYPMKSEWYRTILKPGRIIRWNTLHPISAIPVQVKFQSRGVTVYRLTVWCTPKKHILLAMKEGAISIYRSDLTATIIRRMANVNQVSYMKVNQNHFLNKKAGNLSIIHAHIDILGRSMLGTLTLPKNRSIIGSILFIPGSGPTNKEGNNPYGMHDYIYKQLAYDLAEKGYAMLRYNKASISPATEKQPPLLSLKLYAEDAAAWFAWMKEQKALLNTKMYLFGHSAGGIVALYTVSTGLIHPNKLVLLESPGVPLKNVLTSQLKLQAEFHNAPESQIKSFSENIKVLSHYIYTEHSKTLQLPPDLLSKFPLASSFTQPDILPLLKSEFFINPVVLIKQVKIPTLIVQGEKDTQVLPMNGNKLHAANPEHSTLMCLPNLSHDLTDVTSLEQLLNPEPQGQPLDRHMISGIADYLSRGPQLHLTEAQCVSNYSGDGHK